MEKKGYWYNNKNNYLLRHFGPFIHGQTGNILIVEINLAFIRSDQPYRHIKCGGLARSVRTQQAHDLSLLYLNGHMVHHRSGTVPLYKVFGMNGNAQLLLLVKIKVKLL